jgi:hypothetical protein
MSNHANQASVILGHLNEGNPITALEALNKFGCFRLAARVHELRREGWDIQEKVVKGVNGKRYAEYYIPTFQLQYA